MSARKHLVPAKPPVVEVLPENVTPGTVVGLDGIAYIYNHNEWWETVPIIVSETPPEDAPENAIWIGPPLDSSTPDDPIFDLSNVMGVVIHGEDGSVERPEGYVVITWVGSVLPLNIGPNDIWYNDTEDATPQEVDLSGHEGDEDHPHAAAGYIRGNFDKLTASVDPPENPSPGDVWIKIPEESGSEIPYLYAVLGPDTNLKKYDLFDASIEDIGGVGLRIQDLNADGLGNLFITACSSPVSSLTTDGFVQKRDIDFGLIWNYDFARVYRSSVDLSGSRLATVNYVGEVHQLEDGQLIASHSGANRFKFILSSDGQYLYCETSSELRRYPWGETTHDRTYSPLGWSGGSVDVKAGYVVTSSGRSQIYCFDESTSDLLWSNSDAAATGNTSAGIHIDLHNNCVWYLSYRGYSGSVSQLIKLNLTNGVLLETIDLPYDVNVTASTKHNDVYSYGDFLLITRNTDGLVSKYTINPSLQLESSVSAGANFYGGFANIRDDFEAATPYTEIDVSVPIGGIIMYSGNVLSLPAGWALCDGTLGTPDLRGRFIVGSEGAYSQGDTGGADEVTLSVGELPAHSHSGSSGSGGSHTHGLSHQVHTPVGLNVPAEGNVVTKNAAGGSVTVNSGGSHSHSVTVGNTGGGAAHENRPPYYALAYIMRVDPLAT